VSDRPRPDPAERELLVAIDATSLLGNRTGVGTFTHELIERVAVDPGIDLTCFAVSWRGRRLLRGYVPPRARVAEWPMAARRGRAAWLRSDLPPIEAFTGRVDVVHGPNFVVPPSRRGAEVVTVHDLTAVRFPQLCTEDTLAYPALVARAIARGATVHTPSEFVAHEVVEHFGVEPARVIAIANGVGAIDDVDPAEGHRLAGGDRYVLGLGTVEPRKDLPLLVAAFDAVAALDRDLRLVIAGPDGWGADALTDAVARAAHRDRIVRVGWVDDHDRAGLLRGATVFAFPSVYEGFGIPPLEAMVAGVPVVATAAGSLPEVLGDAALLVAPGDGDALAEALSTLVTDPVERRRLVERGATRSARCSWDTTATRMTELYRRVAR
jgi:glycosyltransferase involved in cell wall biosynthesis